MMAMRGPTSPPRRPMSTVAPTPRTSSRGGTCNRRSRSSMQARAKTPEMRVPSKSKKAPILGPEGAASISAVSS